MANMMDRTWVRQLLIGIASLFLVLSCAGSLLAQDDEDEEEDEGPPARPIFTDSSDEAPLKVTMRGGVALDWIFQDGPIRAAEFASTGDGDDRYFLGRATLDFDMWFRGGINGKLVLENRVLDDGVRLPLDGDDGAEIRFEEAWIEIPTVVDYPWDLRFGVQTIQEPDRPLAPGGAFLFDPAHSESPFAVNAADGGVTFRDERSPIGAMARWSTGALSFQPFVLVLQDGDSTASDEVVSGAILSYLPSGTTELNGEEVEERVISALLLYTTGPASDQAFWTAGLSFGFVGDPGVKIDWYGDLAYQLGDSGPGVDLRAWALRFGGNYRWEKPGTPRVGAGVLYLSGDDNPAGDDDENFRSWESDNTFLLVQDDQVGLDLDTNLRAVTFTAGIDTNLWGYTPDHLHSTLQVGWFELNEEILPDEEAVGVEVDLLISWDYAASLTLHLDVGYLMSSDYLDARTDEDSAFGLRVGAALKF